MCGDYRNFLGREAIRAKTKTTTTTTAAAAAAAATANLGSSCAQRRATR